MSAGRLGTTAPDALSGVPAAGGAAHVGFVTAFPAPGYPAYFVAGVEVAEGVGVAVGVVEVVADEVVPPGVVDEVLAVCLFPEWVTSAALGEAHAARKVARPARIVRPIVAREPCRDLTCRCERGASLAGPQDESWAVWSSPSLLMMGMCAPFPDDRQSGVTVLRKGGGAPGARRHWSGGIARGVAMNQPGTGYHDP